MSLFDAYDPTTYASGGSLLDQLLQNMPQQQFAPGPGFGPNPMDANAQAPAPAPQPQAPQNDPIAVGTYQMPRIGGGFPDDDTPAPQQPVATPAPAAAPQPNPLQDAGDHLKAAWQSMRNGGGLIGGLSGLVTGQRDDPLATAQATQQAALQKQVSALVKAGVPQQQAILAVINPKAAESILPQYLGADKNKFVKIGQDGLGREEYGFVNEQDKTITPVKGPAGNGGDNDGALGDMSKTGAAYLATLPPQVRGTVQAMVEGRVAPPSSFALSKPYWQNMLAAAQNVDPTFDSAAWSGRVAGVKSFTAGADAGTVRSANQVLGHISDLADKADALHNGDYPALNWAKNKWDSNIGSDAANNWVTQAHAVADELSSFMKGAGHSSDAEIHAWLDSLSPNMSPQQQRGSVQTLMGIYEHALQALEDKRTGAVGSIASEKMGPLLTQSGQAARDKIQKWAQPSSNAAPAISQSAVEAEMRRRGLLQ
jgi:hypothetical protein